MAVRKKGAKATDIVRGTGDIHDFDTRFVDQLFENNEVSISEPADIRQLLRLYKDFLRKTMSDMPIDERNIDVCGLQLKPGFNHLYGPPDSYRTTIGCLVANTMAERGYSVAYIDAENKIEKDMLHENVLFVRGSAKTPEILKKLVRENLIDFAVIDTICTMSRYEDALQSLVKYLAPTGRAILLLNQTRISRYNTSTAAGTDMIVSLSQTNNLIVSRRRAGKKLYIVTNNKNWFVFDTSEERPVYDLGESLIARAQSAGEIKRLGQNFLIESEGNKHYTREETAQFLIDHQIAQPAST